MIQKPKERLNFVRYDNVSRLVRKKKLRSPLLPGAYRRGHCSKIFGRKHRKLFETKKIKLDVLKSEKIIGLN